MTTIAVTGINGFLGKPIINALLQEQFISKIKTPIKLVTSSPEKKPIDSDKVEYINYKETPFTEAFKGVDVVINLGNVPKAPLKDILDAVIANKVKLYIPSQFGVQVNEVEKLFPGFGQNVKKYHSDAARKAGIKTVDVSTGLFIDSDHVFVGGDFPVLNFDKESNTVEIVGDESVKINPSYYTDIGNAVAVIATADDYNTIPDQVRIYSDEVTIGDTLNQYEKKHKTTLKRKYIEADKFVKDVKDNYAKDGFQFANFRKYLQTLYLTGDGNGFIFETSNERELINPGEGKFVWTRYPKSEKV